MNNKDFKQMNEKFFDFLNKTTDPKGADKNKVDPGAVKSHGMLGKAANLLKRSEMGMPGGDQEQQPEDSDRIWGLNGENNPESLESLLKHTDCIDDKQKAAFLNHMKELADDENIALEEAVTLGGSKSEKDRIFSPETVQELMDFIGEFDLDAKCNKQLLKILNVWGTNNTVKFSAPSGVSQKKKEKEKEPEEEKLNCKMSLQSLGKFFKDTVAQHYYSQVKQALKQDIPDLTSKAPAKDPSVTPTKWKSKFEPDLSSDALLEAREVAPDLDATLEVLKDIVEKNKEAAEIAFNGIQELLKSCNLQLSQGTVAGLRKIGLIDPGGSAPGKRDDIEKGDSFVYTSKKGNKSAIQVVDPENEHGATISQKIDPKTCDPKKNSEFATNAEKFAASAEDPSTAPVGEPIEKCSLDDEKDAAETATPEKKDEFEKEVEELASTIGSAEDVEDEEKQKRFLFIKKLASAAWKFLPADNAFNIMKAIKGGNWGAVLPELALAGFPIDSQTAMITAWGGDNVPLFGLLDDFFDALRSGNFSEVKKVLIRVGDQPANAIHFSRSIATFAEKHEDKLKGLITLVDIILTAAEWITTIGVAIGGALASGASGGTATAPAVGATVQTKIATKAVRTATMMAFAKLLKSMVGEISKFAYTEDDQKELREDPKKAVNLKWQEKSLRSIGVTPKMAIQIFTKIKDLVVEAESAVNSSEEELSPDDPTEEGPGEEFIPKEDPTAADVNPSAKQESQNNQKIKTGRLHESYRRTRDEEVYAKLMEKLLK